MTTRNVIKFAAIVMICMLGGLAVTVVRIAGPAGLDLVNPKVIVSSGNRGAYFRHQQWMADAKTLVSAVRYWFEPEHSLTQVRIPGLHSELPPPKTLASARSSIVGGIQSTSAASIFNPVAALTGGMPGSDLTTRRVVLD